MHLRTDRICRPRPLLVHAHRHNTTGIDGETRHAHRPGKTEIVPGIVVRYHAPGLAGKSGQNIAVIGAPALQTKEIPGPDPPQILRRSGNPFQNERMHPVVSRPRAAGQFFIHQKRQIGSDSPLPRHAPAHDSTPPAGSLASSTVHRLRSPAAEVDSVL